MGLKFDRSETAPGSQNDVQVMSDAISCPVWAGSNGVQSLHGRTVPETVCVKVDTSKFDKLWYQFSTVASFNAAASIDQNSLCPSTLVYGTQNLPAAANGIGRLYGKYVVELTEPIAASMNV